MIKKMKVPFPMISDGSGELGKAYGVYDEGIGVDIRGRFIIDPDGVIQAMEVLTPPVGRKNHRNNQTSQSFSACACYFRRRSMSCRLGAGWQNT